MGCNIAQPIFTPAGNGLTGQGGNRNIIFRIPTPVFGAGLFEAIPDSAILANMNAQASRKRGLLISGHPNARLSGNANRSGNDGTITGFGWKAEEGRRFRETKMLRSSCVPYWRIMGNHREVCSCCILARRWPNGAGGINVPLGVHTYTEHRAL